MPHLRRKTRWFSRASWEALQLCLVLWNCVEVPLRMSFLGPMQGVMLALNGAADILYIMDLVIRRVVLRKEANPRLAAIVMPEASFSEDVSAPARRAKRKREELDRLRHNRKRRFLSKVYLALDVAAVVPLDVFVFIFHDPEAAAPFRLLRLLRLVRLNEQVAVLTTVLEKRRIIVNAGFHRMIYLWTLFIISAHWMSCGFFSVGEQEMNRGKPSWVEADGLMFFNGTAGHAEPNPGVTQLHMYVRSFYWAIITMVTVGFGDITPASSSADETLFCLATMYLGMLLTCCVIGNLTNMVTNLDAAEDEFHDRIDNLNKYMAYRNLSSPLRDRIRAYYTYMWTSLKGMDEYAFLRQLPVTLRLQVAGLQSKDLVKQVPFLRKVREPIINAICVALEQVIVSPGDSVVRAGETMQGCFWLRRGEAEVIGPGGVSMQTLSGKTSSFFGENALFFSGTFESEIRAKSYCEFFFLKKGKFLEILSETITREEYVELQAAADKAAKRNAKVKKFFGLDTSTGKGQGWRAIFEPRSRFREVWNVLNFLGVGYMVVNVPYRLATQTLLNADLVEPSNFVLDWMFDMFFAVDVVLRAFCFAYVREGIVVRDRATIFRNYRKHESWITDLLVLVPWDLCAAFSGVAVLPVTRIPKIFVMRYLPRQYDTAQSYFAGRRITLTNALHRIIKIFASVVLLVHFIGCGWMVMANWTRYNAAAEQGLVGAKGEAKALNASSPAGNSSESSFTGSATVTAPLDCSLTNHDWICSDNATWPMINHNDPYVTYLRAIYFVLVDMTTVGYGDIVPLNTQETAYVALITLFGGLGYPAVVGAMAALISSLNTARADFKRKLTTLTQYMAMKKFPRELRARINRYYDYLWSRQRGVDEQLILNDLPSPLRMEVQAYINGEIMRSITFLQGVDSELLRHLFSVLKPSVFLPNDNIIIAGELGQDMYLLERGATRVTSKDGKMTYAVLTPGDYFGEGSLLGVETRTANVVAIGYCDCFVLNKEDFDKVTNAYPRQRKKVIKKLKKTLEIKKEKNASVYNNMQKHPKLNSITSYDYEVRAAAADTSWRHPDSIRRRIWDVGILFILFMNMFTIPYRIALQIDIHLYALNFVWDAILLMDWYLRFKVFGYVDEGEVFTDVLDIKENYRKGRRWLLDFFSLVPFDFVAFITLFIVPETLRGETELAMACLRLPRLLLLLRITPLVSNLDHLFEASRFKQYDVSYKLLKLVVTVLSISHWFACCFYLIAKFGRTPGQLSFNECEDLAAAGAFDDLPVIDLRDRGLCPADHLFDTPNTTQLSCGMTPLAACKWDQTWIGHQMEIGLLYQDEGYLFHQYLRALNWALPTLVVVVIGDTIPVTVMGTLYVTVGIIIGVTINAAIIGSIANLVANLEGSVAKFREKMDKFEKFLYLYRIPPQLQRRTRHYLEYLWETEKGTAHSQLVDDMPETLRAEVSNFLKLRFVESTPFFEFCDKSLQKGIASKLKQRVYSPMDYIIFEGDIGTEMYFIEQGRVQMVSFRGKWRTDHRGSTEFFSQGSERRDSTVKFGSTQLGLANSISKNSSLTRGPTTFRGSMRRNESQRASLIAVGSSIDEKDVTMLATLEAGSFFGETAVFFNERRSCSVRASDFTEVYVLSRDDLDEVLFRFPHNSEQMFEVVRDIRANNAIRNEAVKNNMDMLHQSSKLYKMMQRAASVTGSNIFGNIGTSIDLGRRGSKSDLDRRLDDERNSEALRRAASLAEKKAFDTIRASGGSGVYGPGERSRRRSRSNSLGSRGDGVDIEPVDQNEGERQAANPDHSARVNSLESVPAPSWGNAPPKFSKHLRHHGSILEVQRRTLSGQLQLHRIRPNRRKRLIFKPQDRFYRMWNVLSLVFSCYLAFTVPFRVVFYVEGHGSFSGSSMPLGEILWLVFDYAIDVFFIADMVLRLRHFAINRFGKVIVDRNVISQHYRNTWLAYDVVACFPLDVLMILMYWDSSKSNIELLCTARVIRLVRLCKINYYLRFVDQYVNEMFPRVNSAVLQTLKIFLLMLFLNHAYACTWFSLHRFFERGQHNTWAIVDGLATYDPVAGQHNIINASLSPWFCYLRSLYFTVTTMSSVGYGDIRPYSLIETIHELLVVTTGACTFAALIGSVAVVYLHWDSRGEIAFKSRLRKLIEYMEFRELPPDLQQNIVGHFTNRWERFEGVELREVVSELPLPLQLELSICIHQEIINKVRGLRKCHVHVQRHVARKLVVQISSAKDFVYQKGEIGSEIYFILSGEAELVPADSSKPVKRLRPGSHFGGDTLYSVSGERCETVRCVEDCELYYIHKDDFERIMFEFPEHRSIGIFAELTKPGINTLKQSKELKKQIAEIAGNVRDSPLAKFSSKHIDSILGGVDTSRVIDQSIGGKKAREQIERSRKEASKHSDQLDFKSIEPAEEDDDEDDEDKAAGDDGAQPVEAKSMGAIDKSMARRAMQSRTRTSLHLGHTVTTAPRRSSAVQGLQPTLEEGQAIGSSSFSGIAAAKLSSGGSARLDLDGADDDGDDEIVQDLSMGNANRLFGEAKKRPFGRSRAVRGSVTFEDAEAFLTTMKTSPNLVATEKHSLPRESVVPQLKSFKKAEKRITELK